MNCHVQPKDLTDEIELLNQPHPCLIAGWVECQNGQGQAERIPILLAVRIKGYIYTNPYIATQFGMEFGPTHLWFAAQHKFPGQPEHPPVGLEEAIDDWINYPTPAQAAAAWFARWWHENVSDNQNIPELKARLEAWEKQCREARAQS